MDTLMNTDNLRFNISDRFFLSAVNFMKPLRLCGGMALVAFGLLLGANMAWGREFVVLAYNVENLFDADGVARFDQYKENQEEAEFSYSPRKVLTKIRNIGRVLALVNGGSGPEVALFQEIELDRTPESAVANYADFLEKYADRTVGAMLTTDFDDVVAGLPAEALLLKYLEDNGMTGYHVIKPVSARPLEERTAQNNVVFSKFPIEYAKFHALERARDILEVGLSVEGHSLILFDNHWKSGASNAVTEILRVQNAGVLRKRLDEILAEDPSADIVLGGDFNSYYNQKERNPEMTQTALNDVLRSRGDEKALIEDDGVDLYNLWLELPPGKRGSEVYRGRWGTLMQLIVTPGLYDFRGIQYVDNSFFVLAAPGLNVEEAGGFGRPKRWYFYGTEGGGFSDHLPVGARFRTVEENLPGLYRATLTGGIKTKKMEKPRLVNFRNLPETSIRDGKELETMPNEELGKHFGKVYEVESELIEGNGKKVRIGGRVFEVVAFKEDVRTALNGLEAGSPVHFWGELGEFRGRLNFVIQDSSWWKN